MDGKDFVRELLEIYLRSRSSMPQDGYVPEFRTTVDIQEELEPMLHGLRCGLPINDLQR